MTILAYVIVVFAFIGVFCTGVILAVILYSKWSFFRNWIDGWMGIEIQAWNNRKP